MIIEHLEMQNNPENKKYRESDSFNVEILPGRALRIFGSNKDLKFNKMFQIGDTVNATGFQEKASKGEIKAITDKSVIIERNDGTSKRFKYYNFIWRNYNFNVGSR